MPQTISLGIDNPCSESWDRMSPNGQGRFCGSCRKTVVDFSLMTDQQVLQWFTQQKGSTCGRFAQDQLQRSMAAPPERKTPWRFWQYLIAGLLISSEASSQSKPKTPPTVHYGYREMRTVMGDTVMAASKPAPPDSIRGMVVDSKGKPVNWATIMFGPQRSVAADFDGYFAIPMNKLSPHQTLTVSALGYKTVTISADQLSSSGRMQLYPVVIKEEVLLVGEVVVTRRRRKRTVVADTVSLLKDTLAMTGLARPALTVYPNPVARGASLTISARLDQAGNYQVQLYNMSGALMETRELPAAAKSRTITLPVPAGLAPGTYFVRLSHPALTKCYTQQIIVF